MRLPTSDVSCVAVVDAAAQEQPEHATVGKRFAAYGLHLAFVVPVAFLTQLTFGFAIALVPQDSPPGRVPS